MSQLDDKVRTVATALFNQAIVNLTEYDVSVTCRRHPSYAVINLHVTDGNYHVEKWLTYRDIVMSENYYKLIDDTMQYCDAKIKEAINSRGKP